jgi:hypothetical protein
MLRRNCGTDDWERYLSNSDHPSADASSRNRTGTPFLAAADFKSAVSTYFTIEACAELYGIACNGKTETGPETKKGSTGLPFGVLERETRLELATSTLARLRSTN